MATGQTRERESQLTPLLLIVPIWLVILWVVGGLCFAARVGDHMPRLVEDRYVVEDMRQDDAPAHPERAGEQGQPYAPAAVAGRRAA